jgi:hypothetical protein
MAMARTTMVKRAKEMEQCITDCMDCHSICMETTMYCLMKGGKYADPKLMRMLRDCSEMCQTTANFMLRESPMSPRMCSMCAEMCMECADMCEQFKGDKMMTSCAEVCRRCAKSCEQMAKMSMEEMMSMAQMA